MKFFEKNIKDRFKNASSLEGVDPDDLWNNIESSIAKDLPKRKFIYFRKGYLLILLSLLLIGAAIIWNPFSGESLPKVEINYSSKTAKIQNTDVNNLDDKNVIPAKKNESKELNENRNVDFLQTEKSENPSAYISSKSDNNQFAPTKIKDQFSNPIENKDNLLPYENKETNFNENILGENETQKVIASNQKNILKTEQLFNGKKINFTKIESIDLLLSEKKENQQGLSELIILSKFKHKKSKFSLGIFTGIHTIKNKFSSIINTDKERRDLLNQAFQIELGNSFALETSFHFNENIFFTTGLEYLKSKSEFNLVQSWDTIIVNPNSHVGSLTDAFATRTIKHHNKMEYFSLPILLGFKKSYGKIAIGMSSGIGLNFTKTQTGKSLNFSNQISFYPSAENDLLPVSKFFVSYHIRPFINYDLDEKISIQLRTDFRYQNFGDFDFHQLKYTSNFWGLSGGVQFMF